MKRMRSVSIYLGAILAASAVAAASASATVRPHFVFAGTPPPTSEEVNIKLVSPSANFYVEGSSSRLIECTMARGHGEILNSFGGIGMINKLAITFEECSVPGHTTTCSINGSLTHGSIKTAVIESELGYEPPAVTSEVLFNMVPNGGVFGEVTFSGSPASSWHVPDRKRRHPRNPLHRRGHRFTDRMVPGGVRTQRLR